MYGKMKQHLRAELDSLGEAGLYKRERVIVSPQRAAIGVAGGKEVINFCANNYLGLSDHPRLIEAAKRAMDSRGYGMSSVRFICGTQDIHRSWRARSPTISARRTRFSMPRASMRTAACSSRCSTSGTRSSPMR